MSPILSAVLFASAAAAQVTTSLWLPTPFGTDDHNFQASVVGADGEVVTMAIVDRSLRGASAETLTIHGSTSFENVLTTTDEFGEYEGEMTLSYGCSKGRGTPVCVASSNGPVVWSAYCAEFSSYVSTELESVPAFCSTGSLLPEDYAVQTVSGSDVDEMYVGTYAVTITAGEQKLSAAAGATPAHTPASSTPTGSATATNTPSSSPSSSPSQSPSQSPASSASSGPAPTPTPPAQQSSNAAPAPMKTAAPALVGLGAFVAAFM